MSNTIDTPMTIDDTDLARAQEYALLANLLARSPNDDMLARIALLRDDASELGLAHAKLAESAAKTTSEIVLREYFDLFSGLGKNGLLPYASYYVAASLYGRPLSRLRETLQELGIARSDANTEPEDHAATFCEIMAGMANGDIKVSSAFHREFFEEQVAPWIRRFFTDLEKSSVAKFYARVGMVGRIFMDIEAKAFKLQSF
ncbi:TorA maturation chaperone TorD [Nitrobacteraceae bacterium AZCC 1564]